MTRRWLIVLLCIVMALAVPLTAAAEGDESDAERRETDPAERTLYTLRLDWNGGPRLLREKHVHVYHGGDKCERCGAVRHDYDASGIPELYYRSECPEEGMLLTVCPKLQNGNVLNAPVQVYLPYGYRNTEKYNVLFLVPGSDGHITDWMELSLKMSVPLGKEYGTINGKRLFDWLIYTGQAAPFIAVSIEMQPYNGSYSSAYGRYADLIVYDWLPMIVDGRGVCRKSDGNEVEIPFGGTYAESSAESDLEAAKAHFAIAGASQGATFVSLYAADSKSKLGKRFGHEIIMSAFVDARVIAKNYLMSPDNTNELYFVSGGKLDVSGGTSRASSYEIMEQYKKNETLSRFPYYTMQSGHRWYTWFRGIAAVLQDAMKDGN